LNLLDIINQPTLVGAVNLIVNIIEAEPFDFYQLQYYRCIYLSGDKLSVISNVISNIVISYSIPHMPQQYTVIIY
jgi:hypothetical protein